MSQLQMRRIGAERDSAESHPTPDTLSRRDFIKLGLGALAAVAAAEAGVIGLLFLKPRTLDGAFGGVVVAGSAESFPPGSVTPFPDGRFFLVRMPNGGFLALYRRCPHLGCTVHWQEADRTFFCPCHASHFDVYGDVINPPAAAALSLFPIDIRNGDVRVDTAGVIQRDHYLPWQLTFATQDGA